MTINDKEYGKFEVCLSDNGTWDIVLNVYHFAPNGFHIATQREITFTQEYGAGFRNDNEAITDDGFKQLAQEAVEVYIKQYLT